MDPIGIAVAFVFGFLAKQIHLPPLVGFLIAGFVLNAFGVEGGETLQVIADLGVTLLLFTIGLKLNVRGLLAPEVWASTSIHMAITVVLFGAGIYALSLTGLSLFAGLDLGTALLIAFALSFSSTVFAVKVLEERGEMPSLHGRISIGILIMQDVFAVLFLTVSTGKIPSPWAIALLGLFFARPLLMRIMDRTGHGELMPLFGLFSALVLGAGLFELVGLKPDLGALILGVLLAGHPKAAEISESLFSFKDIFLVGFFLSIGLSGVPSLEAFGVALLLVLVVPFKMVLFFLVLSRFRLRARSSLLASLSLAPYSEFGLIVCAVAVANGWVGIDWIVAIAMALSATFILAAPLNTGALAIYARFHDQLIRFETKTRHRDDVVPDPGKAQIAVVGMGRVGTGVYDYLRESHGDIVLGLENDAVKVETHRAAGRNVQLADASDFDFWELLRQDVRARQESPIKLVFLAMPEHSLNIYAAHQLANIETDYFIAALAKFPDEAAALKAEGVDVVFNFYSEAGAGFAAHVCQTYGDQVEQMLTGKTT